MFAWYASGLNVGYNFEEQISHDLLSHFNKIIIYRAMYVEYIKCVAKFGINWPASVEM